MAIIRQHFVNGISANFWKISEVSDDFSNKSMFFKVDLYISYSHFLDGNDPITSTRYTYKGPNYFIEDQLSETELKKQCYTKLKSIINGGYDYPTQNEPWCPKIYLLLRPDVDIQHFHNIDYTIELITNLYRVEIFGEKGLLTRVDYYSDSLFTDKVLVFNRTYEHNPIDGIVKKHTTRTYINVDGSDNNDIKDLGEYIYTENQGRKATIRRRENIIFNIEKHVIKLIKEKSLPGDLVNNMILASQFMSDISTMKNSFISSGNPTALIMKLSDNEVLLTYPFLGWSILSFDNVIDFVIDQLTY